MKVEFAIFAHAAQVDEKGYINMLGGGFDVVKGSEFPGVVQSMNLVVRVLIDPQEVGREHKLIVEIRSPENKIVEPRMEVTFTPNERPRDKNVTFNLSYLSLQLPVPGDYQFCMSVGGEPIGTATLEVAK